MALVPIWKLDNYCNVAIYMYMYVAMILNYNEPNQIHPHARTD